MTHPSSVTTIFSSLYGGVEDEDDAGVVLDMEMGLDNPINFGNCNLLTAMDSIVLQYIKK